MTEQQSSKEWATRARFEKIKAEMPEGIPGYSEFRFDWMHDALRELIDYCDALHADEPTSARPPCKGKNCGSTDPRYHSAECFKEYDRSSGANERCAHGVRFENRCFSCDREDARSVAAQADPLEAVLDRADDKDYSDAGVGKMLRAYKNEIRATTLRYAQRYLWLRSHIAGTIVTRLCRGDTDWRPERMDQLIDTALPAPSVCGNPLPGKRGPCVMPDGHEGPCDDVIW